MHDKDDQSVAVVLSRFELKRIDDWALANGIPDRGAAIRRLIENGFRLASDAAQSLEIDAAPD